MRQEEEGCQAARPRSPQFIRPGPWTLRLRVGTGHYRSRFGDGL